jgi:hypothetical protein
LVVNAADTLSVALIVTVQLPVPVQAPLQPIKLRPWAGVAVNVTCVPPLKLALHVEGQLMPEGELDTFPLPVSLTLSVYWFWANVAVTASLSPSTIVNTQFWLPEQAWPQPLKAQPLAGVADNVTCVPGAKLALHVVGQLIPAGELATVPLPVTLIEIATFCWNVAVTDSAAFIATVQPPLPLQAPPQPPNDQPLEGVGVKVTCDPPVKLWLHTEKAGQLMPAGLLVTVPMPWTVTVRPVLPLPDVAQLVTRLLTFTVPMPVAKSQPVCVLKAGAYEAVEVDSTP